MSMSRDGVYCSHSLIVVIHEVKKSGFVCLRLAYFVELDAFKIKTQLGLGLVENDEFLSITAMISLFLGQFFGVSKPYDNA